MGNIQVRECWAFTVVEVLLVLFLCSTVMVLGISKFSGFTKNHRVNCSQKEIKTALNMTKEKAILNYSSFHFVALGDNTFGICNVERNKIESTVELNKGVRGMINAIDRKIMFSRTGTVNNSNIILTDRKGKPECKITVNKFGEIKDEKL
ncbi:MAG: hypothetical protein ACOCZM_00665 [Bacillota bacterium]